MTEPQSLKAYIAARKPQIEAELASLEQVEERIAALRLELDQIVVASAALEQGSRRWRTSHPAAVCRDDTIQGRILLVLADRQSGMTSADIVTLINQRFGEHYASTSIRPQLSRLAQKGELWHENRRWGRLTAGEAAA